MQLTVLDPQTIERCWDQLCDRLSPAINPEQSEPSMMDLKAGLEDGSMLLVQMNDGDELVVLSSLRISDEPQGRTVTIDTLVGSGIDRAFSQYMEFVEQIALSEKADRIVIKGRAGWARYLKGEGYTEAYRVLVKPIKVH